MMHLQTSTRLQLSRILKPTYPTLSTLSLYVSYQVRNQDFFRAGEVSENKGTSINI